MDFEEHKRKLFLSSKFAMLLLEKRLYEFEDTPSGSLTADEFDTIDLEEECDPPSFIRSRQKEKRLSEAKSPQIEEPNGNLLHELEEEMEATLANPEFKMIEEEVERVRLEEELEENVPPSSLFIRSKTNRTRNEDEGDTFSDIDDSQLEDYFNTDEEVIAKTLLWNELNKDYLEMLATKEKSILERPPKKKRKIEKKKEFPAETAAEAAIGVLRKKVSTKINYSALGDLFHVDNTMFDVTKNKSEQPSAMQEEQDNLSQGEEEGESIYDINSAYEPVYEEE